MVKLFSARFMECKQEKTMRAEASQNNFLHTFVIDQLKLLISMLVGSSIFGWGTPFFHGSQYGASDIVFLCKV